MENTIKLRCHSCRLEAPISDIKKHPKKDAWICINCFKKLERN